MSAQPMLFHHARDPDSPPLRVDLAIDRWGFVTQAGNKTAEQWDALHPCCAPHRIATFTEETP